MNRLVGGNCSRSRDDRLTRCRSEIRSSRYSSPSSSMSMSVAGGGGGARGGPGLTSTPLSRERYYL